MARYQVRFVSHAAQQRDSLPADARRACDEALKALSRDPYRGATDHRDGSWSIPFGAWGVILYVVHDGIVTVTVLRVMWAG